MRRLFQILLVLAVLLGFGFLGGLWNATRPPVVARAEIAIAGLPPGTRLRLLHISDTHQGHPDMPRRRLEQIVQQANALQPDLVVLTGDYHGGKLMDWPGTPLEDGLQPLAGLRAPLGVFAILGNHDEPYWVPRVLALQKTPRLLVNESVDIGPLVLVGVDSAAHTPDFLKAFKGLGTEKPIIVLAHEPDNFAPYMHPWPALALAGHTHGGQIVLPIIGSLGEQLLGPQPCRRGLCTIAGVRMFVSSGVGTSWLPMRYGVPPEIVLITLYSSGRNAGTDK